ncbi:MAG: uracil-DNA glycosylase, partial [Candidatus Cloacimonetes bacterium]|nr:uracil-DNA glycosylase [Candidatus Cloacimonadota bacterium]
MKVCDYIKCVDFPCTDIDTTNFLVPYKKINPRNIQIIMITEAPPPDKKDYFYANGEPFYLQTTIQAFNDAGVNISGIQEILDLGIYITTAIKCGKTQFMISTNTIKNCIKVLEEEVNLFPNIKAFLLMG